MAKVTKKAGEPVPLIETCSAFGDGGLLEVHEHNLLPVAVRWQVQPSASSLDGFRRDAESDPRDVGHPAFSRSGVSAERRKHFR